jgi:hypothetical protein
LPYLKNYSFFANYVSNHEINIQNSIQVGFVQSDLFIEGVNNVKWSYVNEFDFTLISSDSNVYGMSDLSKRDQLYIKGFLRIDE